MYSNYSWVSICPCHKKVVAGLKRLKIYNDSLKISFHGESMLKCNGMGYGKELDRYIDRMGSWQKRPNIKRASPREDQHLSTVDLPTVKAGNSNDDF